MSIKVAYDITCLGNEAGNNDNKSGILRVTEEVMHEISKISDVELTLMGICSQDFLYNALNCTSCVKNDSKLTDYEFTDVLTSRPGLRNLYDHIYTVYASDNFQKLPRFTLQTILIKGAFKLLRTIDAKLYFDYKQFDLLHSPYHALPSEKLTRDVPRLLTIHDLIPAINPELVHPFLKNYFREILNSINSQKDWIVCNSEYTRQEFCEYTGMSVDRTFVTPLAASSHFHP
ncbi:MAG: glycosyltransferase, partial [Nostocaceae cyanobacterium]|nr:glycosyltransferase [Nostocaceae cyanobacterium]